MSHLFEDLSSIDDDFSQHTFDSNMRRQERIPDAHLQSPIRAVFREMFVTNKLDRVANFIKPLVSSSPVLIRSIRIDSERIYGALFQCTYTMDDTFLDKWIKDNYCDTRDIIDDIINLQLNSLGITEGCIEQSPNSTELHWQSMKLPWERVRYRMQEARNSKIGPLWKRLELRLPLVQEGYLSAHLLLLRLLDNDQWWLLDYDQVMMVSDVIMSRCNVYTYLLQTYPLDPVNLSVSFIQALYKEIDTMFSKLGNQAYDIIAMWEPCVIASSLRDHDRLPTAQKYVEWFEGELNSLSNQSMKNVYNMIRHKKLNPHDYGEIFGLYRHWGHPTVNELAGCAKVKMIAKNRPIPDQLICLRITGSLKRHFIIGFINRHGRWPGIKCIETLAGTALQNVVIRHDKILNFYSPKYPLEHWALIRFEKEINFDYHADFTDLIEDTACCVERDDLRSVYSPEVLGYKPERAKTLRRVLLESLRRKSLSIQGICDLIQCGNYPDKWKIVLLHAKERELKLNPRLFAMLVLEIRLYFCVTEKNVSDHLFSYFPQQTMTLDESELIKRLYNLTGEFVADTNYLAPVVGIDFRSWNLCWTFLSTFRVFEFIDDLFGTPGLYLQSHIFFESCVMALASYYNPPETLIDNPKGPLQEGDSLWYNHLGGLEGIRQKCWTLVTIGMLIYIESEVGIKSYIIGQGDNQLVKIILPTPSEYATPHTYLKTNPAEIQEKIENFLMCLSNVAQKMGHEVKNEETWVALDFVIYGKDILYKGSFVSQAIKKISRLFPDVNNTWPNLYSRLSSIQSCALSAAQKSFDIVRPYRMGTVEFLLELLRSTTRLMYTHEKPQYTRDMCLTKEEVNKCHTSSFKRFIALLSTDVGGIPMLPFSMFLYRGVTDPLTAYLTNLYNILDKDSMAKRIYIWLQCNRYRVNPPNPELLVSNPYAINIKVADMLSTEYKDIIFEALKREVGNVYLSQLFNFESDEEDQNLFEYLVQATPCHPRVLHEIFRQTVTGARLSFISKFGSTRTTQSLISGNELGFSILGLIQKNEVSAIRFLLTMHHSIMMESVVDTPIYACPTQLAHFLRNITWYATTNGQEIDGVTVPFPSHQFIPKFFNKNDISASPQDMKRMESIYFQCSTSHVHDIISTRGPYPVFVGSSTREKVTGKLYQLPTVSRPLDSAIRLWQIHEWVIRGEGLMTEFIKSLIRSRTMITQDIIEEITPIVSGGSVVHRLNDHCGKRSTNHPTRPNITTHLHYTMDLMGKYSRGLENYNIHFQGAVHLGCSLFQLRINYGNSEIPVILRLDYRQCDCEERLDDVIIQNSVEPPKIKALVGNPLVYSSYTDLDVRPGVRAKSFGLVKLVKNPTGKYALAHLIVSRIIKSTNMAVVGPSDLSNPITGKITIADLMACTVSNLIVEIACLLSLMYPRSKKECLAYYHNLDANCFYDIANLCLVPELYPDLCNACGLSSGIPDAFLSMDIVCGMLKLSVGREIFKLHKKLEQGHYVIPTPIFYPQSGIGAARILGMWARYVDIVTAGVLKLETTVKAMNLRYNTKSREFYTEEELMPLMLLLNKEQSPGILGDLCEQLPIRISRSPPEVDTRSSRYLIPNQLILSQQDDVNKKLRTSALKSAVIAQPIVIGDLPLSLMAPSRSLTVSSVKMACHPSPCVRSIKTRIDQQYRLFGNVSTSHLKIIEILLSRKINLTNSAVTLAEGEGSIARLLLQMGAPFVYHNTLVDRKRFVPQRAIHFIPACLINHYNRTRMTELSVMTGGDITDINVILAIKNYIGSDPVSIVTCDAEMSSNQILEPTLRILKSWLYICASTRSPVGLFKLFLVNDDLVIKCLGSAQTVYQSVEIIVPTFSSHENYEAYMICTDIKPLITEEELFTSLSTDNILICSGIQSVSTSVTQLRLIRIKQHPFQSLRLSITYNIYIICQKLGVEDNAIHSINQLFMNKYLFVEGPLKKWLEKCQRWAEKQLNGIIDGTVNPYYGLEANKDLISTMKSRLTLHNALECYSQMIFYSMILQKILPISDYTTALQVLMAHKYMKLQITNDDNRVVYTININDETITQLSLKYIWRIWGHKKYSTKHDCPVAWE